MASSSVSNSGIVSAAKWNEELVFPALISKARRKLLFALVSGPNVAFALRAGKGAKVRQKLRMSKSYLTSTLKDLKVLTDAGLVVSLENPQDRRRCLYALAPGLQVTMVNDQAEFDFGFVVARLSADGN